MAAKKSDADVPSTLERSPEKARDVYLETLASAEKTYGGDESAAHRVAWGAVKHEFEKVGDHWEAKAEAGPSDSRSAGTTRQKLAGAGETHGGVDVAGHSRAELAERAKAAGARVTSRMTKAELGDAIARKRG